MNTPDTDTIHDSIIAGIPNESPHSYILDALARVASGAIIGLAKDLNGDADADTRYVTTTQMVGVFSKLLLQELEVLEEKCDD